MKKLQPIDIGEFDDVICIDGFLNCAFTLQPTAIDNNFAEAVLIVGSKDPKVKQEIKLDLMGTVPQKWLSNPKDLFITLQCIPNFQNLADSQVLITVNNDNEKLSIYELALGDDQPTPTLDTFTGFLAYKPDLEEF